MDRRAGTGRGRGPREPDAADEPAHRPRWEHIPDASVERLQRRQTADWHGAYRTPSGGRVGGAGVEPTADLRRRDPEVTHAIISLGINDIRNRMGRADEIVSAEQMIVGLTQLAPRAQAKRIKFFAGTLPPFGNETFFPDACAPEGEAGLPVYDCGDHLHRSNVGYNRMGDIMDLSLFD